MQTDTRVSYRPLLVMHRCEHVAQATNNRPVDLTIHSLAAENSAR